MSSDKLYEKFVASMEGEGLCKPELLESLVLEAVWTTPTDNNWKSTPAYVLMFKANAPEPLYRLFMKKKYPHMIPEHIGTSTSDNRTYYALFYKHR
jgi:hypothetical protein